MDPSDPVGKVTRKNPMGRAFTAIQKAFGKRTGLFEKDLPVALQDRFALGVAVREDPHATDALAGAYEIMGRVEANVRTVSNRLVQSGFAKAGVLARAAREVWLSKFVSWRK